MAGLAGFKSVVGFLVPAGVFGFSGSVMLCWFRVFCKVSFSVVVKLGSSVWLDSMIACRSGVSRFCRSAVFTMGVFCRFSMVVVSSFPFL